MNYQEFESYIKEHIKEYLSEAYRDAQVWMKAVTKNNTTKLNGLVICITGEVISPIIYLDSLYDAYKNGTDMETILIDIAKTRESYAKIGKISSEALSDAMRNPKKIIFRVIGRETNQELLQTLPHRSELDLAIVYSVLVANREEIVAATPIREQWIKEMKMEEEMLYQLAFSNTPRELPAIFESVDEFIKRMADGYVRERKCVPEFLEEKICALRQSQSATVNSLYVLSNGKAVNGAGVLFYPGMQEQIAKRLGGDYFVLPTSVDEMIITPCTPDRCVRKCKVMVEAWNQIPVKPEQVLTNQVYRYDTKQGKLKIADCCC